MQIRAGAVVDAAPSRASEGREPARSPRAVPCCDHAFDDALLCRCGTSWWTHQRLPEACPLNARRSNRRQSAVAPADE